MLLYCQSLKGQKRAEALRTSLGMAGWSEPKALHNQHVTRLSPAHPCQEARAVLPVGQPVSRTEKC